MLILTLDVGTTCVKAQLFNEFGEIVFYSAKECKLKVENNESYIDINALIKNVSSLVKESSKLGKITSISFSSLGESFVCLDKNDNIIFYPMLYSDPRGYEEAEELEKYIGNEEIFSKTGTVANSIFSISKLLWIKKHYKNVYEKIDKIMLICDYLGYLLTDKRVIDYSLAARTGVFNVYKKDFDEEILNKLNIDKNLWSEPKLIGSIVGQTTTTFAKEIGLSEDTKLILGSHDQICATLGAGVSKARQAADGMGTVECITTIFDHPIKEIEFALKGYPVVPFLDKYYCTYALNYSSNSLVDWFKNKILKGYKGNFDSQFEYLEQFEDPTDLLVLPYFAGAATPYQNSLAKGAIINLDLNSKNEDIYRAILEGTSYEMKLNLEVLKDYNIELDELIATGGGSNSKKWVKIKSDILNLPISTLKSSEGGLCGLAIVSFKSLGITSSIEDGINILVKYKNKFTPSNDYKTKYENKYLKYKKIYKNLKEIN